MIAERVEDNVLLSSIPGEEASWGWGGRHLPSRDICQLVNHKEKEEVQGQEFTGVYVHALRKDLCPGPLAPGAPLLVSALA